ncbi:MULTISPECIES: SHOCT domain-containing protein [Mycobacterium]|uniref:Membrane protein n=1 Tax=Mycobacterium kiyosense TaxID=2871094 RepID=A0A9P3Q690_9MYCO|nr:MULTISPECIES: SHOCT domain-containing protein [Mycobacterium]BDB40559.1 membrane protein [Mycobacterium kiyosense]BDE12376.1 membrane protein [Mycobacterium sp. 20KCMC460]GLB85552.1 membrane protein [Mycobacterium kiyosense]GLB88613.1 membrane protein [Mycobacterium kiyosense]GLB98897.1 membrane protein [Mycobacterium kiyosense]
MLARYIKMQLLVLLCGGLVGPIFLVVYFATGFGQVLSWMFYAGLLITVADVLIAIAMTYYGANAQAKSEFLEQHGVLALAQIVGLTETGTRINDQQVVKVRLHVSGSGITPFESEDRVIASVTRLGNLTAGKLVVLVDPATNEYRIDWERSALINGLVPAQFSVEEDGRTYDLRGQSGPLLEILQILKANNIPLNRMVDVRSNPALRQQIQGVVRRAAQSQAAPQSSVADRLQELDSLRASGAVNDQEYASKRAQIISEI